MDFGFVNQTNVYVGAEVWQRVLSALPPFDASALAAVLPNQRPLVVCAVECDLHAVPSYMPESAARVKIIRALLHRIFDEGARVDWMYVRGVLPNLLPALVHCKSFLTELSNTLSSFSRASPGALLPRTVDGTGDDDGETYVSAGTADALHATSEALRVAVNAVLRGENFTAAVITRPPGHHCSHFRRLYGGQQFGFCLLNNAMQASV
jgi:acetoin utilization deacetylase AcuC-like enzyme